MYTTDEWGNTVFHITTGRAGIEAFEKLGVKNMEKEAYDKHMASYRKLQKKRDEELKELMEGILKAIGK